jgi:hypothetical protein
VPKPSSRSTKLVTAGPRYLWHYALHEQIASEQLAFVLASFEPSYKRERVIEQLKLALRNLSASSYALWELIGGDDLMVQAWLPRGTRESRLREAIDESITSPVSADLFPMTVDEVICHWMTPDQPLDVSVAQQSIDPDHFVDLNGPVRVPPTALKRYVDRGYVFPVTPRKRLKFFLRISPPRKSQRSDAVKLLADRIRQAIDKCEAVTGASLMRVQGDGVAYLVTGRLAHSEYEMLAEDLHPTMSELGSFEVIGSRTNTHLSALYAPIARREQLLPYADDAARLELSEDAITTLLAQGENDRLECKASAFTDMRHKVGQTDQRRSVGKQFLDIGKAVVGMLNAGGGRVILGAVEAARFSAQELTRAGIVEPVRVGEYLLAGIEHEYDAGDWDAFLRKVTAKLRSSIEPRPTNLYSVDRAWVGVHQIVVIDVRLPQRFYFLKEARKGPSGNTGRSPVFYGREAADTLPFEGAAMFAYCDAHPRANSG